MKSLRNTFLGLALLSAAGCASYYQVTDTNTGKVYYSTSSQMEQTDSGATTFVDATTGDRDTLQNTQVAKITKEQFEAATSGAKSTTEPSK
jgi:hypothetical protein